MKKGFKAAAAVLVVIVVIRDVILNVPLDAAQAVVVLAVLIVLVDVKAHVKMAV